MFRIENADRTVESYLIEVATSNFAELYNAEERMQNLRLKKSCPIAIIGSVRSIFQL